MGSKEDSVLRNCPNESVLDISFYFDSWIGKVRNEHLSSMACFVEEMWKCGLEHGTVRQVCRFRMQISELMPIS